MSRPTNKSAYWEGRDAAAEDLEATLAMMFVNCEDIPDNTTVKAFRKYAAVLIAAARGGGETND